MITTSDARPRTVFAAVVSGGALVSGAVAFAVAACLDRRRARRTLARSVRTPAPGAVKRGNLGRAA